jgi:hypothetical protein
MNWKGTEITGLIYLEEVPNWECWRANVYNEFLEIVTILLDTPDLPEFLALFGIQQEMITT